MTDLQFKQLLRRTALAQREFSGLLEQAEAEYERRYGANPSDAGDDSWIDALTGACGKARIPTLDEVDEGARMSGLSRVDTSNEPMSHACLQPSEEDPDAERKGQPCGCERIHPEKRYT